MLQNKQILSKKYIAIILLLVFSSLILCTLTLIGYFTSKKDDIAYVSVIHSDIAILKAESTNGDYVKINKLIETGAFYIHKDQQNVYFLKPHSLSQVKLKSESNKSKSTFINKDFANSENNVKLKINHEKLKKIKFMGENGLFSSFGNVFSYRLYPLVLKVFVNIIEFLNFDGFVMVIFDDESVRVGLYENDDTVTNLDYWFRKQKDLPPVKDVMKHMLYRFKNA